MHLDFIILDLLVPVLTAVILAVLMRKDRRLRSLATVYLAATVTMGFGESLPSRIGYQVIEVAVIVILLSRLRFVRVLSNPAVACALGFTVLALISLAGAALRGAAPMAVWGSTINVIASCLGAAFLLADMRASPNHAAALKATAIPIFLVALTGIYEAVAHGAVRVSGIYANINPFAYMMAIGFMLSVHFYRGPLRILFVAVIAAALFFTQSRAAFLMAGAYCVFRIWWLLRRGAVVPLLAAGLAALVVASVGAASIVARFEAGGVGYNRSVDAERQLIYRSASSIVQTHPLTGIGWGQFKYQFRNYGAYRLSSDAFEINARTGLFGSRQMLMTHNDFLSMPVELGIPFTLVVLAMFLLAARRALSTGGPLQDLVLTLFVGNIIYSLSHNSSNSVMFFYLMFLPLAYSQPLKAKFTARLRPRAARHGPSLIPAPAHPAA